MLHGHNLTHSTKKCRTLKQEAKKHKKGCKNGNCKNKKHGYNPSKEEIHAFAAFSKEHLERECKDINKELKNFENMSRLATKKTNEK